MFRIIHFASFLLASWSYSEWKSKQRERAPKSILAEFFSPNLSSAYFASYVIIMLASAWMSVQFLFLLCSVWTCRPKPIEIPISFCSTPQIYDSHA